MFSAFRIFVFLVAATFVLASAALPAGAEDVAPKPPTVAVVDLQELLRSSKAAQNVESQLQKIRKDFQSEVEAEEKKLRADEKAILDQRGKLPEEELKAKASEFQKKVGASQKKIQERKTKLDKALGVAIGKLRGEIVKIVAEISDKKGLDLVLARTDVVIVAKELDITKDVLERINKDLSEIKVVVE